MSIYFDPGVEDFSNRIRSLRGTRRSPRPGGKLKGEVRSRGVFARPGEIAGRMSSTNVRPGAKRGNFQSNIIGPTITHQGMGAVQNKYLLSGLGNEAAASSGQVFNAPVIKSRARKTGRPSIGATGLGY